MLSVRYDTKAIAYYCSMVPLIPVVPLIDSCGSLNWFLWFPWFLWLLCEGTRLSKLIVVVDAPTSRSLSSHVSRKWSETEHILFIIEACM